MEAKGCAKPAVWKEARRHFYWSVRARIARSEALASMAEASPGATYEYRVQLLNSLADIDADTDYREMADNLEDLDLSETLARLRADSLIRQLIELTSDDRKAALEGLVRLADNLTEDERSSLINVLKTSKGSPGVYRTLTFTMTTHPPCV